MRILLVVSRHPWPVRRGDQMRADQALAALAPEHEVTLLAPRGPGVDLPPPSPLAGLERYRPSPWVARLGAVALAALGGRPLQQGLFASRDLARRLRRLAPAADLVLLQLSRLAPFAAAVEGRPLLVDLIDSLALNVASRADCDRGWLRPALRLEARRLAHAEDRLVSHAARTVVVAERDRAAILARRPDLAGRLAVVPLAVAETAVAAAAPPERPRAVFTGNLGYFPNRDAVRWLLDAIWPVLRRARPELELVVAGDRPGRALSAAARAAGATLVAAPPSLDDLLAGATVALAPLRCGSGVPVKVLEAWAAGVPVVASPWAAAGLVGAGGVAPDGALAVAATPEEWAREVVRLLDDRAEAGRRSAAGREWLRARHCPERVAAAWRDAVREAGAASGRSPVRAAEAG